MTIPKDFKPLLALELSKVKNLPKQCYVSPKIDGLRCIIFGGVAYSRSLKPIPNLYLQSVVKQHEDILQGLDGELLTTYLIDPMAFNRTQSDLMSIDGEPNFAFHILINTILLRHSLNGGLQYPIKQNYLIFVVFFLKVIRKILRMSIFKSYLILH